ncbi:MAG: AI-2E family transporter [Leptospiraceae bacterium]|nr:AI-2E family transporter [Leptospiraceae bacterium]
MDKQKSRQAITTISREHIVPWIAGLLLIGAGWLVFVVYQSYAWPTFLALLIYVGFDDINQFLIRRLGKNRSLAALITVFLVILLILIPSIYLLSHLVQQLSDLVDVISTALKNRQILYTLERVPWLVDFLTSEPFFWVDLLQILQNTNGEYLSMLDTNSLGNWLSNIYFLVKGSLSVTLGLITNLLMALIILFFLFRDGPLFYQFIRRVFPFPEVITDRFTNRMRSLIRAVFWGNIFVSFLQGAAISIGLSICGIHNSIVYGVIAAVFALIPIIGTGVVWAPTALYLLARGDYGLAIFIAVYGVSMYLVLENIVKPKLLDRRLGLHPLLLFFAILGGLAEFGVSGVFLGPLFVTLFVTMWSIYHVWGGEMETRHDS